MFKQKKYIFIILLFLTFGFLFFYNKAQVVNPVAKKRKPTQANLVKPKIIKKNIKQRVPASQPIQTEPTEISQQLINKDVNNTAEPVPTINDIKQEQNITSVDNIEPSGPIRVSNEGTLQAAPRSKTDELFEFNEYATKHPVKLAWSPKAKLKYFEIKIYNTVRNHTHKFQSKSNELDIMIYPNEQYTWQVQGIGVNDEPITDYSEGYKLKALAPEPRQEMILTESEDVLDDSVTSSRELASTKDEYEVDAEVVEELNFEALAPAQELEAQEEKEPQVTENYERPLWSKLSIWGGLGFSLATFNQESTSIAELSHTSLRQPHLGGELEFMISDQIGVTAALSYSPGHLVEESNLFDVPYTWETYSLEALYLLGNSWKDSMQSSWYLRAGVYYQATPLMAVFQTNSNVDLVNNEQINASLGVGLKSKISNKLSTHVHLNGQIPISSETSNYNYELDSGFTMQAFTSLKYRFKKQFHLGAYWQGKLLNINYFLSDEFENTSGNQLLLNNNFGIFMGYDF